MRLAGLVGFGMSLLLLLPIDGFGGFKSVPDTTSKEVRITDRSGRTVGLYTASYALVIGVSDYRAGWRALPGVAKDTLAVEAVLKAHGFDVQVVQDPSGDALRHAFADFIRRYGHEKQARLLIYFAGHGHTMHMSYGGQMGYIVPVDAPKPAQDTVGFQTTAMDMQQIEVYAKRIQAKHVLFMFDSCFSGSIFDTTRSGRVPSHIGDKTDQPVRQFITSGDADEEVPDVSLFRQEFVAALRGDADGDRDGYITGTELGEYLHKQVVNYSNRTQTPQHGKIRHRHLDKGDFVFSLPRPPGADSPSAPVARPTGVDPEQAYWEVVIAGEYHPEDLQDFLNTYPDGRFAPQARLRLRQQHRQAAVRAPSSGPPDNITDAIGMSFKLIPAGRFRMGTPGGSPDEQPVHQVLLRQPFYMGVHEVTQAQWQAVMGANPSQFQGDTSRPVEGVSWDDVQAFIAKLNEIEGEGIYRLPTEAEWAYAAQAGGTTRASEDREVSPAGAWCEANSAGGTHPVGQHPPNAWGLYDMHGNVWEWVQDWYGPYTPELAIEPQGPSAGIHRVLRGGSWFTPAVKCRATARSRWPADDRDADIGLRLVRRMEED